MAHMYFVIVVLLVAGLLAVWIDSRRVMKRTCAELHLEFQRQINTLSAKVTALASGAGPSGKTALLAEPRAALDQATAQGAEEIAPETLAKISESITALLGNKVRIRSVKILQSPDAIVNTWAQQGRVVVQASHNFAQRGREL